MSFDDDVSDFDEGEKLEKDNFSAVSSKNYK